MEIGKVVGSVWATKKDEQLNGHKLLVLKVMEEHDTKKKDLVVASDIVGAGVGDLVLIAYGSAARNAVHNPSSPVDAAIVGIVDKVEVNEYE